VLFISDNNNKVYIYKEEDVVRASIFCGSNDTHLVIHITMINIITIIKIIILLNQIVNRYIEVPKISFPKMNNQDFIQIHSV